MGHGLSELTKITTLTHMILLDMQRAVEADKSIKTFSDTWNYVMEQIEALGEAIQQEGPRCCRAQRTASRR